MNFITCFFRLSVLLAFIAPIVSFADRGNAVGKAYAANSKPEDFNAGWRKGLTTGYYLGFTSLADEMRDLRRPSNIPVTNNFFKSFYLDFHFANQEFNLGFYDDNSSLLVDDDAQHSIENTIYGITLGFSLGDNPNLDVRIPLSSSRFKMGNVADTGFLAGIELFPNYRINEYIAWGVNLAHNNSSSDFPIFDESMTSVSFETMAESSPAYGMNWSGRLSIGRYFPSNEANDESFWLAKGTLALHYHLHQNFTMLPFIRYNYAMGDMNLALTDHRWWDYGAEFILMPNSPWNFSLGIAGVGGHSVIEEGMEFYLSTKGNF
jgi:hypothetical protein